MGPRLLRRAAAIGFLATILAACIPPNFVNTAPDQPKIVKGELVGHRVCGDFHASQVIYSFTCDALPTIVTTGWQLTPLTRTTVAGKTALNTPIRLTVTTPTATQLDIQFMKPTGGEIEQTQISSGVPANVGSHGQVLVAKTDDGATITWTLTFGLSPCDDAATMQITNVLGNARSNPLDVVFLRAESEVSCPSAPFNPTGSSTSSSQGSSGTGSNPVSPATTSHEIVIVSGPNNPKFAIIDYTNPPPPQPVLAPANPPWASGLVLGCNGSKLAVGTRMGGQIALFDVSNPGNPSLLTPLPISTGFVGVAALKFSSSQILVGEVNGPRVELIDVTDPLHPIFGSPFAVPNFLPGIGSVTFAGTKAIVTGTNNSLIHVLSVDVSHLTVSDSALFDPGFSGGLGEPKAALDGNILAVGSPDLTPSPVELFDLSTIPASSAVQHPTSIAKATAMTNVTSIALKNKKVVAGSSTSSTVSTIDFNPNNPVVAPFPSGFAGSFSVAGVTRTDRRLGMAAITGNTISNNVTLFDVSGAAPRALGAINSGVFPVGSLCVSDF